MSGIEIAGLILAIIPLIHNARKYSLLSDSLLTKIAILGKGSFATEIRISRSTFSTQKAIFRARANTLLQFVDLDHNEVIRQPNSYLLRENTLSGGNCPEKDLIKNLLQDLVTNCKETMEEILVHLASITSSLEQFQENPSDSQPVRPRYLTT
ncbi:hypothetical protein F5B19DRAFT_206235 [Rostrohypoxylon terebratum]|nr:hypothetical protein F5B19DRAFT_206235 [Rostrohypoxylon terebratum]